MEIDETLWSGRSHRQIRLNDVRWGWWWGGWKALEGQNENSMGGGYWPYTCTKTHTHKPIRGSSLIRPSLQFGGQFQAVVQAPPCGSTVTPQEVLYDAVASIIPLLSTSVCFKFSIVVWNIVDIKTYQLHDASYFFDCQCGGPIKYREYFINSDSLPCGQGYKMIS